MCGIFGAISLEGYFDRVAFERFVQLTDLVRYRGPDDAGYTPLNLKRETKDQSTSHFDVFLGSRRLSIIDLSSSGHQPMTDGKGRWIVFNGEIFNYVELRSELRDKGHSFHTGTDTEVILHVYDEYGEDGFAKLNGMWAFAIVDSGGRRIILSRDRFSLKPLYVLRVNSTVFFASEIKQLLPLVPRRELNAEVMSVYLTQGLVDHSRETFFRGITSAAPKSNLVLYMNTGKTEERHYWDYQSADTTPDDCVIERFRELFMDSVKIRLRSDVPVGVLLSGGLDSSAIAAVANQLAPKELLAYSVVSTDRRYSEEGFIDTLSRATSIQTRKLLFRSVDVAEALDRVIYHSDEPFAGLSVLAQYKILEMVRNESDVTVLLSGQGGDEVLLGYFKFFFFHVLDLLRKHNYIRALKELLLSFLNRTVVHQFRLSEAKRYLPRSKRSQHQFIRFPSGTVPISEFPNLETRQMLDIDKYSVPALARYEDRNSMAHSLEVRHPFLDHRLVVFLLSLAPDWKLKDGWTKVVLRESLPELPAEIRWRRDKQGFSTPEEAWLREDLRPLVRGNFQGSRLAQIGILDDKNFLDYYDDFLSGRRNIWYADISRTLIAEMWAQKFLN